MEWLVLLVLPLLVFVMLLSWTAGRVDRLHHRVEKSRAVLDAALFHRSGAAVEIASAGVLDPAASLLLLDAAHQARVTTGERDQAESDLTRALVATFPSDQVEVLRSDEGARELLDELADACRTVELSRRFHNDAVRSARDLRGRWLVRWFGLAGRADLPSTSELDDTRPPALG
jgi:hypothetical protein